jgi:hypothetical protein
MTAAVPAIGQTGVLSRIRCRSTPASACGAHNLGSLHVELFADVGGVGLGEDGADRRGDHLGVALGNRKRTTEGRPLRVMPFGAALP